jgi:MFS family permease
LNLAGRIRRRQDESISEVGNSVTVVVIPLVALDTLHTSTFIVTLLVAMVWVPWVIIGIPAGAWVDRLLPRPVMLASDVISVAVYASVRGQRQATSALATKVRALEMT